VLRRIHELSGGNPFFALELARAPERLEAAHGLPPSLEALVSDRISSLPENTRVALVAVAAASRATIPLAESVAGAGSIAPAEQARVVEVADGAVRFAHPLLASGAYAAVDPALRRDVHAQLADLVEDDEQRARHLAAAATGADESIAAALEDAAARARSRGAPADAADLGERAATLTPAANEAAALRRTADAGYYRFESGDGARALAVLGDVAARLPRGPDRARVLIQLARVSSYAEDLETATELFLQAAAEAGDDREAAARALEGAATQLFRQRRDLDAAVRYARRSAKLAGGLGDDALLATALSSQLLAEATLGRSSARRTLAAALEHQDAATAERLLAQPRWSAAVARMWWDEPAAVRDTYDEVVARGREPVDEGSLAYVYVMLGQADILLGDFERAEADAAAALDIARQAGQAALVAYAHAVQALLDAHRGRADECRAAAETALELAARTRSTPAHHAAGTALGLLQLSLGQPANAAATLAPLVELARAEEIREPGLTRYVPDYVEALVETGRGGEAGELLDWYEENAGRLRRRSAVAAACRCRALLAASDAELEEALVFAERALAEQEALPFPFDRARSLLVYGATLRRVKRKADARTALEDARATFQSLGASAFAARAASELGRIGGRGRSDDRLTATERGIAELVAEGKSNKEVAAALFVSVKTVEANLSRTYAKLGIHSRTALAKRLESGETAGKE
jgi:DNA-binding CsgD family transcriptional regulator